MVMVASIIHLELENLSREESNKTNRHYMSIIVTGGVPGESLCLSFSLPCLGSGNQRDFLSKSDSLPSPKWRTYDSEEEGQVLDVHDEIVNPLPLDLSQDFSVGVGGDLAGEDLGPPTAQSRPRLQQSLSVSLD